MWCNIKHQSKNILIQYSRYQGMNIIKQMRDNRRNNGSSGVINNVGTGNRKKVAYFPRYKSGTLYFW